MHGLRPAQRASRGVSRSALTKAGLFAAGLGLLLTSCTSGSGSGGAPSSPAGSTANPPSSAGAPSQSSSSSSSTSAAPQPLAFAASPTTNAGVSPTTPITLAVTNGTLRAVSLVNSEGKHVAGALSADKRSWHATEVLGYSKTYSILAKATDTTGESTRTYKHSFTTLTPGNMTMPYLDTIYGSSIQNGASYGVAMVPVVSFDEDITRKKVAERALTVTTSPHVDGSWYWTDDHTAHWRPEHFYQPGTKITVAAKVYGLEVGDGLYGQADQSVSFKIGRKQITIAHDTAPKSVNKVRVYRNNHLVHTMNTSMGEHTGETVNGKFINFYTLDGTYTVLGFENPAHMCSDTYGLPANAPGGYGCEDIPWSTKISTDGIYLHELDTTIWAQDSGQDVSHGCLNLDYANAHWFFTHSIIGDPVIIHGAKGAPKLQLWQGGDWSLSWAQWQKGSAYYTS
jgi:lipoprotein-anchoring transpeptidase ErfK/SrfK